MIRKAAIIVVVAILMVGCAGMQAPDTPEKAYTVVRIEFNKTVTKYLIEKAQQTDDVHAQWTKDIDPVIRDAEMALDAWGMAIDAQDPDMSMDKEQEFLTIKNHLFDMLIERGIK